MAVVQQFRTAIRGFNRQDVQDYIEQMIAAHQQELTELQKQLKKSERRIGELEEIASRTEAASEEAAKAQATLNDSNKTVEHLRGELSQAESKLEVAKKEIERLRAQVNDLGPMAADQAALGDSNQTVDHLRGELSQAESKLEMAKKEIEHLQAQVNDLRPLAAGYQEIRDRAAGMELEASQKAKAVVNEAKAEADRIRTGTRRWLSRVMEEYSDFRCGLDEVLEKIQALTGVPEKVEELDEEAKQLRDQGGLK